MPIATRHLLVAALGAVFIVPAACGAPARPSAASPSAAVSPTTTASATPEPSATVVPTTATAPVLRFSLTDVRTGERFMLGGFGGKTVIVQGMAVW